MVDSAPRTALVTGSNRGIGRAISSALASRGLRVLTAARTRARAEEAADAVGGLPEVLDLDDPEALEARARDIQRTRGPVDVLVNNAAILPDGYGLHASLSDLTDALRVNLTAPFALMRAFAPGMEERGYGRIVNMSSGWGAFSEGVNGPLAYAISKASLNALTLAVSSGLGAGVKVNAVCPGWVRTDMGGAGATRSPQEGADTPVWLATLPEDGPSGGFFRDRQPIPW